MNNYVYLLLSLKDRKTYLGSTDNLGRRLKEHELGQCRTTKNRRPLKLIYKEEIHSLSQARLRERFLKTKKGRKELKNIFSKLDIGE